MKLKHSLSHGSATFVLLFAGGLCSCAQTSAPKPCRPGCVDDATRLECDSHGQPRAVPCPESEETCAAPVCSSGTCGFRPAVGASCGKDGAARCNEGYACLGPALTLTAIRQHTCAVADDGKVWCWGNNQLGELGDGTTVNRGNPVPVRDLPGRAVAASAGYAHTCALLDDGRVACWGDNSGGQIALPSVSGSVLEPTIIEMETPLTSIAAGQGHTCGTTAEGLVYCWGNSLAGQCGVPGDFQVGPTRIPDLDHVTKVQTVKNHICAVRSTDPTLVCWGSNQYLEDGGYIVHKLGPAAAKLKYSATPVPVDLGARVVDVGMGFESSYAVTDDGFTYSWGFNRRGQLGLDTMVEVVETPSRVMKGPGEPLQGAAHVWRSDGSDQCVEMAHYSPDARYLCWGGDDYGELGFGAAHMNSQYAKDATVVPNTATNLVRGEDHGCFSDVRESGVEIACYGRNNVVGNGSTADSSNQMDPAPVVWDPANFEAFVVPRGR